MSQRPFRADCPTIRGYVAKMWWSWPADRAEDIEYWAEYVSSICIIMMKEMIDSSIWGKLLSDLNDTWADCWSKNAPKYAILDKFAKRSWLNVRNAWRRDRKAVIEYLVADLCYDAELWFTTEYTSMYHAVVAYLASPGWTATTNITYRSVLNARHWGSACSLPWKIAAHTWREMLDFDIFQFKWSLDGALRARITEATSGKFVSAKTAQIAKREGWLADPIWRYLCSEMFASLGRRNQSHHAKKLRPAASVQMFVFIRSQHAKWTQFAIKQGLMTVAIWNGPVDTNDAHATLINEGSPGNNRLMTAAEWNAYTFPLAAVKAFLDLKNAPIVQSWTAPARIAQDDNAVHSLAASVRLNGNMFVTPGGDVAQNDGDVAVNDEADAENAEHDAPNTYCDSAEEEEEKNGYNNNASTDSNANNNNNNSSIGTYANNNNNNARIATNANNNNGNDFTSKQLAAAVTTIAELKARIDAMDLAKKKQENLASLIAAQSGYDPSEDEIAEMIKDGKFTAEHCHAKHVTTSGSTTTDGGPTATHGTTYGEFASDDDDF